MSSDLNLEELMARHAAGLAEQANAKLANASAQIAKITTLAATKGFALDASSFEYTPITGVVATAPGLAKALLGSMQTERDGLLLYRDLATRLPPTKFQPGYFVGSDFMLMAHSCFRRQMHPKANWAPRFIEILWELELQGVAKYVAIDEDRVRLNVDNSVYLESDTWYGAPFNEDVREIKLGTAKLRPPLGS